MTFIRIDAVVPPCVNSLTFAQVDKDIPLYVPYGTKQLYEEDYIWGEFTNIIEMLVSVNEAENENFEIYPNPVVDQLHVACQGLNHVSIYDAQGRKIISTEAENENACHDFSKQATGVYFVVVTTAEGCKKISRVVKE